MDALLKYRGRLVSSAEVTFIRELIASHSGASRRSLAKKLCEAWGWQQPNGTPKEMVCRGLMLTLHRAGHIELPPVRFVPLNPLAHRKRPMPADVDFAPLCTGLSNLEPLAVRQVRRTEEESLFNGLMEAHHYLGYTQPVGEHLKLIVYTKTRPVALFSWSSAARHLKPRDSFIGWSAEARRRNIHFIAYNSRFLILPWVHVPHLASHLLGKMARILSGEWEKLYRHPLFFLETFINPERFRGTCYRAANWLYLGRTTGRGKDDQTHRANRPLKEVLGYPLTKDFRKRLCTQVLP